MATKSIKAKAKAKAVQLVVRNAAGTPPAVSGPLSVFERFAKDPTIDVEKLGRLIEFQKDILHVQAKEAYNAAYVAMQAVLPTITKRGKITGKGDTVRSRYAKLEDIQTACKPILRQFGFALRHRTEWPREGIIRVVGILSHLQGHSEESAFEAPMDSSEYRTQIQSMGSTVSCGRRYTTIDLLNLTQVGIDNDGQGPDSRRRERTEPPPPTTTGYETEPISDGQRKRLFAIAKGANRTKLEIQAFLQAKYHIDSTATILRKDYDAIVAAIEKPGPLQSAPAKGPDSILTDKAIPWGNGR